MMKLLILNYANLNAVNSDNQSGWFLFKTLEI